MGENKFKVGDRVRRSGGSYRNAKRGEIYTVKEDGSNWWALAFEEIEGGYAASEFTLVETAPLYGLMTLPPTAWQAGDIWKRYTVAEVGAPFHGRVLVKFANNPLPLSLDTEAQTITRPDPNPTVTVELPKALVEKIRHLNPMSFYHNVLLEVIDAFREPQ